MFALAAGVVRLLVGLDIATDNGFLGARVPMLNASSLLALIVLGAVPFLLGLAISVVPRQVGSPSIAFPRAAALSFWAWLITSGIFITSVAINGGVLGGDRAAARLGNVAIGGVMASLVLGAVRRGDHGGRPSPDGHAARPCPALLVVDAGRLDDLDRDVRLGDRPRAPGPGQPPQRRGPRRELRIGDLLAAPRPGHLHGRHSRARHRRATCCRP